MEGIEEGSNKGRIEWRIEGLIDATKKEGIEKGRYGRKNEENMKERSEEIKKERIRGERK